MNADQFIEVIEQRRELFAEPLNGGGCRCPLFVAIVAVCDPDIADRLLLTPYEQDVNPDPAQSASYLDLEVCFTQGIADGWDGNEYEDAPSPEDEQYYLSGLLLGSLCRCLYGWEMVPVDHFRAQRVRGLLTA